MPCSPRQETRDSQGQVEHAWQNYGHTPAWHALVLQILDCMVFFCFAVFAAEATANPVDGSKSIAFANHHDPELGKAVGVCMFVQPAVPICFTALPSLQLQGQKCMNIWTGEAKPTQVSGHHSTRFCVISRETDRSVASRQASLRAAGGRCSGPRCLHSLCKRVFQTPKLQAVLAFIKRSWLWQLVLVEFLFACFRTAVAACGLL